MDTQAMLDQLANYGYGIYNIPSGYIIADPLDNDDGFCLIGSDLNELCQEATETVLANIDN